MAVRIRNPQSSAVTLPLPFRGVLMPGAGKVLALTMAQTVALLGSAAAVLELDEVSDLAGDTFALGSPNLVTDATAARTIDVGDDYVRFTSGSAVSATLAQNNIPIGSSGVLRQAGAGLLTVVEGAGVTVNPPPGAGLESNGQGATIVWTKVSATEFDLTGDLASA